jgi:hypothetical protein
LTLTTLLQVILQRLECSIEFVHCIFGVPLFSGKMGGVTICLVSKKYKLILCDMAHPDSLGKLYFGIKDLGSKIELYGSELNRKNQSSNFKTKPTWAKIYLRKTFILVSGRILKYSVAMVHIK